MSKSEESQRKRQALDERVQKHDHRPVFGVWPIHGSYERGSVQARGLIVDLFYCECPKGSRMQWESKGGK